MRPYDALTLDMAGTLVDFGFDVGLHLPPGLPAAFLPALHRHREQAAETGREVDLCEVLRDAGCDNAAATMEALIDREVGTMVVYPDTLETLGALKARGYRLVLLSNVWSPAGPYALGLQRLGVWEYLDGAVWSYEAGWRKPHPEVFRRALELARTEPARTAHVGDKRTRDVKGAKEMGMGAVYVDRGGHPHDVGDSPEPDHTIRALRELLEIFP